MAKGSERRWLLLRCDDMADIAVCKESAALSLAESDLQGALYVTESGLVRGAKCQQCLRTHIYTLPAVRAIVLGAHGLREEDPNLEPFHPRLPRPPFDLGCSPFAPKQYLSPYRGRCIAARLKSPQCCAIRPGVSRSPLQRSRAGAFRPILGGVKIVDTP